MQSTYFGQSAYASLKLKKMLRNCDVIIKSSFFFKITCYANSEIDSGDSNKNECRYKNEKIFCWWNAENTYQSMLMTHKLCDVAS